MPLRYNLQRQIMPDTRQPNVLGAFVQSYLALQDNERRNANVYTMLQELDLKKRQQEISEERWPLEKEQIELGLDIAKVDLQNKRQVVKETKRQLDQEARARTFDLDRATEDYALRHGINANITSYSFGKDAGGPDEMQDKWTNLGYSALGKNLAPGIVAVNPKEFPLGTVFKDTKTGDVFLASDKHGNKKPNTIDIFESPETYIKGKVTNTQRELKVVDRIPVKDIPRTTEGVAQWRATYRPPGENRPLPAQAPISDDSFFQQARRRKAELFQRLGIQEQAILNAPELAGNFEEQERQLNRVRQMADLELKRIDELEAIAGGKTYNELPVESQKRADQLISAGIDPNEAVFLAQKEASSFARIQDLRARGIDEELLKGLTKQDPRTGVHFIDEATYARLIGTVESNAKNAERINELTKNITSLEQQITRSYVPDPSDPEKKIPDPAIVATNMPLIEALKQKLEAVLAGNVKPKKDGELPNLVSEAFWDDIENLNRQIERAKVVARRGGVPSAPPEQLEAELQMKLANAPETVVLTYDVLAEESGLDDFDRKLKELNYPKQDNAIVWVSRVEQRLDESGKPVSRRIEEPMTVRDVRKFLRQRAINTLEEIAEEKRREPILKKKFATH